MGSNVSKVISIAILVFLVSCGGGGGGSSSVSSGSSLVSITVGGSGSAASLKIEKNTLYAQAKIFLRKIFKSNEAVAAIPVNVSSIVFTVSAPDMPTMTRTVAISGQTSITETFTVPNGSNRYFVVRAYDSAGNSIYQGETYSNLTGTAITLSLSMTYTGPWAKTYGGASADQASSIQQTSDGGYVVAGHTGSFGGGGFDFWVLKLNVDGTVAWQKTYGGTLDDYANSIQQTSDGGDIVAGYTYSFGGSQSDYWVLKLDSAGNIVWQNAYGGAGTDYAYSVRQTSDGGYIVGGYSNSGRSFIDILILKLDTAGNIQWQFMYGRDVVTGDDELLHEVKQTADGGYIVAGWTFSYGAGSADMWILKLNSDGTIAWQNAYGAVGSQQAWSVQQTSDGGYIVAGNNAGIWVLKLDSIGGIQWQMTYRGPSLSEYGNSIQQTSDGGYIVAGDTFSFGAGDFDRWVLKLDSAGNVVWQKAFGGAFSDTGLSVQQTSDGGYITAGNSISYGASAGSTIDMWIIKLNSDGTVPPAGIDTTATILGTAVVPVATPAVPAATGFAPLSTAGIATDTTAIITQQAP